MVRKSNQEKNMEILEILRENSRIKFTDLANKLGITEAAVRKKISKLLENGIIKKFTIDIDWKKIGYKTAIIGFDCNPENLNLVPEQLKKIKNIKKIYLSTGDHQFLAFVLYKENKELKETIEKIKKIEGVKRVCPSVIVEEI